MSWVISNLTSAGELDRSTLLKRAWVITQYNQHINLSQQESTYKVPTVGIRPPTGKSPRKVHKSKDTTVKYIKIGKKSGEFKLEIILFLSIFCTRENYSYHKENRSSSMSSNRSIEPDRKILPQSPIENNNNNNNPSRVSSTKNSSVKTDEIIEFMYTENNNSNAGTNGYNSNYANSEM